jgi:hypothetical protein
MILLSTAVIASSHVVTYLAETANPNAPVKEPKDSLVTPGWIGFLAIFFVGVATLFLIIDMTRRIRRTRYRGEIREQIELERQEAAREAAGLDEEIRGHLDSER